MTPVDSPELPRATEDAFQPRDRHGLSPDRFARLRAAVALMRERLRRAPGARPGLWATLVIAFGFCIVALVGRAVDGPGGSQRSWLELASRWVAWVAGAPVALAAARDRATRDREDGIDALAACRGLSPVALESIRAVAAMEQVGRAIGVPLVLLAVLFTAVAGSFDAVLRGLRLTLAVALFAAVAGITVGGIAAACGRVGRSRGRSLLAVVILGPWLLAGLAGPSAWSIPGALNALLVFLLRIAAAGVA